MSVVVGYVATAEGSAALEAAAAEATGRDTRLVVILSEGGRRSDGDAAARLEEQAQEVERRLDELGVLHEVRQTTRGRDAADDIIAAAEDEQADLIVIGLRRRSPVGKLLLGSNAQRILLDATCPVLAVKPSRV